jgi:hypothetical protein
MPTWPRVLARGADGPLSYEENNTRIDEAKKRFP